VHRNGPCTDGHEGLPHGHLARPSEQLSRGWPRPAAGANLSVRETRAGAGQRQLTRWGERRHADACTFRSGELQDPGSDAGSNHGPPRRQTPWKGMTDQVAMRGARLSIVRASRVFCSGGTAPLPVGNALAPVLGLLGGFSPARPARARRR